jgi:uncharacterized protein (DUF305 family)
VPAAFSLSTATTPTRTLTGTFPGIARALTATVLAAAALTMSACSSGAGQTLAQSTAPVIAPGRPGEPARTLGPQEAATAVPSPSLNAADVRYVQDMITHHRQALEMAALAPSHGASERLKAIADRIHDVQEPEVRAMTTWLEREHLPQPSNHAGHGGTAMPGMPGMAMSGMATPDQMQQLQAASGAAFDRLFLQLMIAHHEGSITMATQVLKSGSHLTVQQWATDVIAEQSAEIGRMVEMLQPESDRH